MRPGHRQRQCWTGNQTPKREETRPTLLDSTHSLRWNQQWEIHTTEKGVDKYGKTTQKLCTYIFMQKYNVQSPGKCEMLLVWFCFSFLFLEQSEGRMFWGKGFFCQMCQVRWLSGHNDFVKKTQSARLMPLANPLSDSRCVQDRKQRRPKIQDLGRERAICADALTFSDSLFCGTEAQI